MRIVNLTEFRALPSGTLFMKYDPCVFEGLSVKGETWKSDFLYANITDEIECSGTTEMTDILFEAQRDNKVSIPMDFDCYGRDGCFHDGQLFAVYEKHDCTNLIEKILYSIKESERGG